MKKQSNDGMRKRAFLKILGSGLIGGLILANAVSGQEAVEEDEERIFLLEEFDVTASSAGYFESNAVSATRTNLPIQQLPLSLNVITKEFLEDTGATTSFEALKYSPGIVAGPTIYDGNLVMRGFQADVVYLNGYRSFGTPTTISLERVEVLRGPAAVIYGQTQPGGIANFITKKPLFEDHLELTTTVGTWDYLRTTVDMGGMLVPEAIGDRLAYRVNVGYESRDDYQDFVSRDILEVAGALTFVVTPRVVLNLEASHSNSRRSIGNGPIVDGYRTGFVDVSRKNNYFGPSAFVDAETDFVQADLRVQVTDWLTSRTIYTRQWRNQRNNLWGPNQVQDLRELDPADIGPDDPFLVPETWSVPVGQDLISDSIFFSQIFIANFETMGLKHQLQVGYDKDDRWARFIGTLQFNDSEELFAGGLPSKWGDLRDYPGDNDNWLQGRTYPEGDGWVSTFFLDPSHEKNEQYYFIDTITAMDDRLNVLLGLRYIELEQFVTTGGTWGQVSNTYETDETVPQLGASYAIADGINLFALYSESLEPNQNRETVDGNPLPPIIGEGLDIGVKFSTLKERLNATVSYFTIDRTNVAIRHPEDDGNPENPFFGVWIPGGNATSDGVELELHYSPSPSWQFYATYVYTDATWEESEEFEPGTRLPYFAKEKATIFAKYTFTDSSLAGLSVRAGLVHTSDRLGQDFGEGPIELPTDTLIDIGFGYTVNVRGVPVELDLFIENVTDEDYLWAFGNNRNYYANKRNVQFSAKISF
jgi:iron complex outermembrane receptor protein